MCPQPADGLHLTVEHAAGGLFRIQVRGHELWSDQPADAGGGDIAPTPVELFVASLASCAAVCAGHYLARHGFAAAGLRVDAGYAMAEDSPARVSRVELNVAVPHELAPGRERALLAVVRHCAVHNTLREPPEVAVAVGGHG